MKRTLVLAAVLAFAASVAAAQQPAPKLFVIATNVFACQSIAQVIPQAGNCQPSILAIGYQAPVGSAIRFEITYTAVPSGIRTTATQTSDVDQSGVATYNLRPPSDFSSPSVTAVLLLPAGSVTEN